MIPKGTRVKYISGARLGTLKVGAVGTVLRDHDMLGDSIAVSWDDFDEGHFAEGLLPYGGPASGWYVEVRDIEIIQEEPKQHESVTPSTTVNDESGTQGPAAGSEGTRTVDESATDVSSGKG